MGKLGLYGSYVKGDALGIYGGDVKKLTRDMQLLKPTGFTGVPRLLNLQAQPRRVHCTRDDRENAHNLLSYAPGLRAR